MIAALILGLAVIAPSAPAAENEATIPIGTIITEKNWEQYKGFMNPGLQALWAGTYEWKLGPQFSMEIGPTHHYEWPPTYKKLTEEYSGKVQIQTLP
jgi:hypothetical protein